MQALSPTRFTDVRHGSQAAPRADAGVTSDPCETRGRGAIVTRGKDR
jgi:hypothetical protein